MNQFLSIILGALAVIGFWIFEAFIFGGLLWGVLNYIIFPYVNTFLYKGGYEILPEMHYFVAVGIWLILKMIKFDPQKTQKLDHDGEN